MYYPLEQKIPCNGIAPTKSEVYTLAAELTELHGIESFHVSVMSAIKSYDYYDDNDYDYDYYYYAYDYYYDYYYHLYHQDSGKNNHNYFSQEEKVLALLFLAAMYSTPWNRR
jgi:hypothetical protein